LGEGKNAANLKQIRAALCFAYKHCNAKNPFAKIDPPLHNEPQIGYLLLADIRRLLDYLKARQQGYGSALAFHLVNALFQTACRFDELIQLKWEDCQAIGKEIVALRIQGKGSVFHDVLVPARLSAALIEWKDIQESFKARRIMAPGGIAFAASEFVFAGYSGMPFSDRAFNLRLRAACRALRVGRSPRTDCTIAQPQSCLSTWERICGKSRSCFVTRISAPPCATPTSVTSRRGRRRKRLAKHWSENESGHHWPSLTTL
jgi:integrase